MPPAQREAHGYPGRLIVVEGCDGSGKSTQLRLLGRWLEELGYPVCTTKWNSSPLVKPYTKKAKSECALSPTTFSLIHASDFADRYERTIRPHLQAGYVVLSDRYLYTALARDQVRGCDPEWVGNHYRFAARPDLAFYFRAPVQVLLDRIRNERGEPKYHEAGMDLGLSTDPRESFLLFQGLIKEQYDRMARPAGFVIMDATLPVEEQHAVVRRMVAEALRGYCPPAMAHLARVPLLTPEEGTA